MLQKVKITAVFRGKQIVKKGTPEENEIDKTSIKTETHGEIWLSTFKTRGTEGFIEGMEVELNIEQNGQYYNFSLPSALEKRVMALEAVVFPAGIATPAPATPAVIPVPAVAGTVAPAIVPGVPVQTAPSDVISPEEIPFN